MVTTQHSGFSLELPRRAPKLSRSDASIILVGCRGAGKRTLGFIAAKHLGRRLLTEEQFFEQITGYSRASFLQQRGREAFERQMAVVLAGVISTNRTNCVIECGTALLSPETEDVIRRLADTNPVIYIQRDKLELQKLLGLPPSELERFLLNDQRHRNISNLEYFNVSDLGGEDHNASLPAVRSSLMSAARLVKARKDFTAFLDLILGQGLARSWTENPFSIDAVPLEYRAHSFVLHLRLSSLLSFKHDLSVLEASAEAVEFIVDTWPDNMLDIITEQVALIRRKLDLPIIFNVEEYPREERRRSQEECDVVDLQLLLHGLRLGVEYVSLDLKRNENIIYQVLTRRNRTRIIGHYTFRGFGLKLWDDPSYLDCYLKAQELGCHIVRILRFCMGDRPDESREAFIRSVRSLPDPKPPLVAYDFSVFGSSIPKLSANLNPVTHELLVNSPSEWVTGVNTGRGALRVAFRNGTLKALHFYTLGSKVHYSVTPSMQRAAFEHYMMAHTFDAKQCRTVDEVNRVFAEDDFGGASVAPPFKLDIMPHIAHLSSHATAIGAVNLVLPLRGETSSILDHANARNTGGVTRSLYGDNTDWSSIVNCLRRAISPRNSIQRTRTTALVIGAGGMARAAIYALTKLGCRNIFIYNRTRARADAVATHFNHFAAQHNLYLSGNGLGQSQHVPICHVLDSVNQPWPEGYQQPTMILSCIPADGADEAPTVDFRMPPQWLRSSTGGVVVELAYEPLITPLVKMIRRMRDEAATTATSTSTSNSNSGTPLAHTPNTHTSNGNNTNNNNNSLWVIVDGLEVVGEMAVEAFELMTGRKAPRNLMTRVCNETWERQSLPFQPQR
ncbi:type I 3-dehydroquinase-domain-containing protein [Microdochium trichocladiopsis]|uniref:Type I 3-dehydroquinase-domain-containing protein n=1 Tax=Microdochium trichocladiopsis TaxID=1682393 RepID=A0A9P9BRA4_9PEZI|nr:type I 3-dehydroquinase-domain-containing protein [Microdochium trichocladiopsis]KAH7035713.1 type I 3-dehydroquinase-domain-containing protein [Microdochium trichocladiopsis]